MLRLLQQRNMALLWIGGLISLIGDWLLLAALPYYVYQLTGSLLATAAMTVMQLAPSVVLSSFAGVFVDRWNRKATLILCNILQCGIVLLLLLVHSKSWLPAVYVVVFVQATVSIFVAPAQYALLPHLVAENELTTANSLFGINNQLARLIGPPLGGALLGSFGINPVVALDSGSFLIVALMLIYMVVPSLPFHIPVLPVALTVALLLGPEQVATGVALQTLMQTSVENSYQGRLFGTMGTTGALFSMLGGAFAGPLGERFGIVPALDVTALLTLVAAGIVFFSIRST
ncbi:MAG TPA: hypothetical protein DHW02_06220 [Ktedonobacter sp.]|nr:hypothetical protein [Ktedonobacter sp.]